jgi:PAS domain S-box-containing protein
MATLSWVLPGRLTAGLGLALLLFVALGAGGLVAHQRTVEMDAELAAALGRLDAAADDLLGEERQALRRHLSARRDRDERTHALIAAATSLGAVLAAATLVAMNWQARRRMRADEEHRRLRRAEAAEAKRGLDERARALTALQSSWEELLRTAEGARRDAARARRLVDANIIGVICTRSGVITEANDAFLGIVGYPREEVAAGRIRFGEITPPELLAANEAAVEELGARGTFAPFEREYLRRDGTRVPVLIGGAGIVGSPGETVGFVIDLTERNRTLAALRDARAQAEAASRAKDEFLAVLSHELRSPLHAVLGWLSILKKGLAAGRDVARAVATVERNVHLQARLVNDLLDVSRIVSNKLVIEEELVDLAMVVHTAVENARPAAAAKGVELACSVAPLPRPVLGDAGRLEQVVGNLLANAVELTPAAGEVSVTVTSEGSQAAIEVRDTGAGIEADFLPHVFDRFRQADSTSTRSHGGLGLGLAIAKTLAELHGGGIEARSQGPGQGATFTVRIPLCAAPLGRPPLRADHQDAPGALTGVTVILLDDDVDGREALRLALELAGASVHACGSPAEARRALEGGTPDVLVSDIGMPGEDGYAFLRAVRAQGGGQLPAIAITGFASKQDREEALRAGFDDHVPKPVDADALIGKLRDLARRSGLRLHQALRDGAA